MTVDDGHYYGCCCCCYFAPGRLQCIVMSMSVCTSSIFCACCLCVAIRCVLPILRMTSCFHIMGPMGFRGVALCDSPYGSAGGRGRGPLRLTGPLARRAGLLGASASPGTLSGGWIHLLPGRWCVFCRVLHAS